MPELNRSTGRMIVVLESAQNHSFFQDFNTLTIDQECVSGTYESDANGETGRFSNRLDEVKSLTIHFFSDRHSNKHPLA